MFHFDFTFPSILILLIFLFFFLSEPRLPVRKNRLFFLLVLAELLVLLFDILSSNADMNYQDLPIWLTAVLNMAYFVFFLARILLYFFYTLNILRRFPDVRSPAMLLYSSVFLLSELLVLSSFRTGAVFLIDQNGYHRGPLYNIIYVCFFFYLLLSFLFIFLERKKLSRRDLISIVGCNVILLLGYIVRMLMPQYLVLNVFYLMALLVIFISFENPAVYTTSYGSFSFPALREYLEERVEKGDFRVLGFALRNYSDAREIYGIKQMEQGIRLICSYIKKAYPSLPFFYLRSGCFALVGPEKMDVRKLADDISARFHRPWVADETELFLNAVFLQMSSTAGSLDADQVVESLALSLFDIGQRDVTGDGLLDLDLSTLLRHEIAVKRALDHAVETGSVDVFLQPIMDAQTGAVIGAEALARLRGDQGNLIFPNDFIGLAEKNGQIIRLGEQVLEKVCRFFSEHDPKQLQWVNVNLSPIQCMNPELRTRFVDILSRYRVPPPFIHLEITEASMIDYTVLTEQMNELRNRGFCFVLDDYGSGYSNLSRLQRLPFTGIKLDMEIVRSHCQDPNPVLPTLVRVFRERGLSITAEGIETDAVAEEMTAIGCDYLQGYLFSRPVPMDEFRQKYL
ncbi:MAG: EAL domain-containing protein [Oscillospiraceae bacterium]|nr:EAL domain-containing protein [Oscillospiraceae bacterium]MBQ6611828.1 EAL domain-containing protein [Oscillospiraceae bacterium]